MSRRKYTIRRNEGLHLTVAVLCRGLGLLLRLGVSGLWQNRTPAAPYPKVYVADRCVV